MDEFNRAAWEMERALNRYPRVAPARQMADHPRWTVGNILGGLLMVSIGGFLIWGTYDDLAEHFKPAQPVAAQQEPAAPDVITPIRTLEQLLADAKHLNAELELLHQQLTQLNAKLAAK